MDHTASAQPVLLPSRPIVVLTDTLSVQGHIRFKRTKHDQIRTSDWFNDTPTHPKRFLSLADVTAASRREPHHTVTLPWLMIGVHTIEAAWDPSSVRAIPHPTAKVSIVPVTVLTHTFLVHGYIRFRQTKGHDNIRISDWFNDCGTHARRFMSLTNVTAIHRTNEADVLHLPWMLLGVHTIDAVCDQTDAESYPALLATVAHTPTDVFRTDRPGSTPRPLPVS